MLTLRDRQFVLVGGVISATLEDPHWVARYDGPRGPRLFWSIRFDTVGREFDEELWEPSSYVEALFLDIRDWRSLSGVRIAWKDRDAAPEGTGFYVFGHEHIKAGSLSFGGRDRCTFKVDWSGSCDIYWNELFNQDVPFSISGTAEFAGVTANCSERDTLQSVTDRLAANLDLDSLHPGEFEVLPQSYQDGTRIARCRFLPNCSA